MSTVDVTEEQMNKLRGYVARGVAWLDGNASDWLGRVDLGRLDMGSETDCLLAQLYGRFWDAPQEVLGVSMTGNVDPPIRHGFDVWTKWSARWPNDPEMLTDVWRETITRLREERAEDPS